MTAFDSLQHLLAAYDFDFVLRLGPGLVKNVATLRLNLNSQIKPEAVMAECILKVSQVKD